MVTVGQDYHCALTIEGVKYLMTGVDVKGWVQEKDVNPFAPRMTIGEQTYSDLSVWSVLSQQDWRHGFGHRRFEDEAGYHKTSGSIDTRHKDVVQLATRIVASDEDLEAQAYQMIDFLGDVYACFDGTAGSSVTVTNGTFEAVAGNDFDDWDETAGSGTVADTATAHGASHAVKITCGASDDTQIMQSANLGMTTDQWYKLSFWTRVDAADGAGRYKVGADIGDNSVDQTTTGVTATSYTQVTKVFQAVGNDRIYFYASGANGDVAYFDDATLTHITGGIRKFESSTSTWAVVSDSDVVDKKVYCLLNNGAYLFAGVDGAQVLKSSDGASWTTTGVDSNADDYRHMALGGGKLWASKDGDNHVHWATSIDASDWDGDENDTNRITVGPGDPTGANTSVPITAMAWFDGFLYVAREDGLWRIYPDDNVAYHVLDWKNEIRTTNGKGMLVWQDKLIIPKGPQLFAFTGTTISDITPPSTGQSFPYTQYGNFEALATFGPYLFVTAQRGAALISSQSLAPNGDTSGITQGWTSTAVTHYTEVDEDTPDYYTTNLSTDGTQTDIFDLANTSGLSGKTINRVVLYALARMTRDFGDPSTATLNGLLRISSTNYSGTAHTINTPNEWATYRWEWTTNPADGSLTTTVIDGMAVGITGVCSGSAHLDCTRVWLEVEYQDTLPHELLCWDGSAWHNLGSVDAGGKCLWLSAATDDLWINDYDDDSTNYNTRYMQVQEHSFLPKDDYPTSGTHSLEISRIDCKLRLVDKCFHELYVEAENLTAARYLTAHYRRAGQAWVSLGNLTQSPMQVLSLSDIEGKYIDLRLDFVSDSATESPILEALALRYMARPTTVYGHTLSFQIGPEIKALSADIMQDYSTKEWHDALKRARNSKVPITYETPYGEDVTVFVTAIGFPEHVFEAKGEVTGTATISIVELD